MTRTLGDRASTALAGLALAVNVAHDATGTIPIAQAILSVASRVLTLIEKVEANREALDRLAQKTRIAQKIKDVMTNHTPTAEVLLYLQDVYKALLSIEEYLEKHAAKSSLRRALSYLRNSSKDVERLSGDLDDALLQFQLVAALMTNVIIERESRVDRGFRRFQDFEIDKVQLIADDISAEGTTSIVYHSASVEGHTRLCVVRYSEAIRQDGSRSSIDTLDQRTKDHDRILESLVTVQKSHPNIASLYGWSARGRDCFTVLKSGTRPVHETTSTILLDFVTTARIDAGRHLSENDVFWIPDIMNYNDIFVDERGEPTIGLKNDLRQPGDINLDMAYNSEIISVCQLFDRCIPQLSGATQARPTIGPEWHNSRFFPILTAGYEFAYSGTTTMKLTDLRKQCPLTPATLRYFRAAADYYQTGMTQPFIYDWPGRLLMLAMGCLSQSETLVHATSSISEDSRLGVTLGRMDIDGEMMRIQQYKLFIPSDAPDGTKDLFRFDSPGETIKIFNGDDVQMDE